MSYQQFAGPENYFEDLMRNVFIPLSVQFPRGRRRDAAGKTRMKETMTRAMMNPGNEGSRSVRPCDAAAIAPMRMEDAGAGGGTQLRLPLPSRRVTRRFLLSSELPLPWEPVPSGRPALAQWVLPTPTFTSDCSNEPRVQLLIDWRLGMTVMTIAEQLPATDWPSYTHPTLPLGF